MELYKDKDLRRFIERMNILEYIQNREFCSVKEIKKKFKWSKSELYRKLTEWENDELIIKDTENKEKKYYSHFAIRKTPKLRTELLILCDKIIENFSQKYKEIAKIEQILQIKNINPKIDIIE